MMKKMVILALVLSLSALNASAIYSKYVGEELNILGGSSTVLSSVSTIGEALHKDIEALWATINSLFVLFISSKAALLAALFLEFVLLWILFRSFKTAHGERKRERRDLLDGEIEERAGVKPSEIFYIRVRS